MAPVLRESALASLERLQVIVAAELRTARGDVGRSPVLDEVAAALRTFPG